ncbi:hypothetical protein GGX14DRAFT_389066 [Mycena pura]|uniref:Glucose-methanol-choline oxidoreductase C-terminal domain-containing protein n=1 Tax=Mycena pura TaxID=153505 RepID=A0AAD6VUN3_9AGAR|nr:hypothetical protein GGX14DRAFT_389066 [Mycena pura]
MCSPRQTENTLGCLARLQASLRTSRRATRARVHTASTDPYNAPASDSGYLTHPADFAVLRCLYKQSRRPTTTSVTETAPVPPGCAAYSTAIACTPRAQTCTDAPASDSGFLAQRTDITALRWVYKQSRKYARQLPLYHGASRPFFPRFPKGGPTAAVLHGNRREWARERTDAFETCTMRLLTEGGVVDGTLNVYSVHRLKVINMSIAPSNVYVGSSSTRLVAAISVQPVGTRAAPASLNT